MTEEKSMLDATTEDGPQPLKEEELFCLEGCSSYPQYHLMRQGFEKGHCAFCNLDRKRNEVLWEDKYFMLWQIPEGIGKKRPLRFHILIVPKRHVRFLADLPKAAGASLIEANRFAKGLGYTGGLNHAREGDMRNNAGTVPHLHFNLFEPDGSAEVRVPVFKDPADREENGKRAGRFAAFYEAGVTPEQFNQLVTDRKITKEGFDFPPGE
jgi:diadenosine tetraphosphate (Ap4A) HIT family hydrolase